MMLNILSDINPRVRSVLFMFLGPNIRSVVSTGKISQKFKSGTLINSKLQIFTKIDFKVGDPLINI